MVGTRLVPPTDSLLFEATQIHSLFITARNEVGARYYFQKRVSRILSMCGRGGMHGGGGGGHAWQGA